MKNRDLYSVIAVILPPLLGLGLIELYVERQLSIGTIAGAVIGLALVMVVIAALNDVANAGRLLPRRRRRRVRIDD